MKYFVQYFQIGDILTPSGYSLEFCWENRETGNEKSHIPQEEQPLKTRFYLELTLPQENVLFIGPKVWSSIPDDIKFSTTFTFKWKLKKHLLHEKYSQL